MTPQALARVLPDDSVDFRALPILSPEREEYHRSVRSFQAHRLDHTHRRLRAWFWIAMVGLAISGTLATTLATLLPLKTIMPLFLVVREDGTIDTGVALADLGADMAQKVVRASIWRYVAERESYSYSDARRRYDLVSLMSAENVQHDYQEFFLRSPDSPQKTIGKRGTISVQEISMSPVREGVFLVRFWKTKQLAEGKPEKISGTATVEYELLSDAPASLVLENPAALRIVRYIVEENTP